MKELLDLIDKINIIIITWSGYVCHVTCKCMQYSYQINVIVSRWNIIYFEPTCANVSNLSILVDSLRNQTEHFARLHFFES